jgi:hypothetical protein
LADWILASQSHAVVIVDAQGRVVEDFQIEHSALGWKKFRERLQPYGLIPFAIETSQGAAVEQLLEAGMIVYPLSPKSAQAYRDRKARERGQRRPVGRLEFCRCLPRRRSGLEAAAAGGPTD